MIGKDWADALRSWRSGSTTLLPIELNIYGARAEADSIGKVLSKSGTFLQFPHYGANGTQYYNPHLLHIEGFPGLAYPEENLSTIANVIDTAGRNKENEPEADASTVVDSILNELSHHELLPNTVHVDRRIKSALLL